MNYKKYDYVTGEDLGYKPDVIQKGKFEYSSLGKALRMDKDWMKVITKKDF